MEGLHYIHFYSLDCMLLYKYSSFALNTVFSLAVLKFLEAINNVCFFCSLQIAHHTEYIVFAQEMLLTD